MNMHGRGIPISKSLIIGQRMKSRDIFVGVIYYKQIFHFIFVAPITNCEVFWTVSKDAMSSLPEILASFLRYMFQKFISYALTHALNF